MILIKLSLFLNQIKSLEKRLRVTEERLHQERSDRANNLSAVEDKLLTENARLQVRASTSYMCIQIFLFSKINKIVVHLNQSSPPEKLIIED